MRIRFQVDELKKVSGRAEFLKEFVDMCARNNDRLSWPEPAINYVLQVCDEIKSNFEGSLIRDGGSK